MPRADLGEAAGAINGASEPSVVGQARRPAQHLPQGVFGEGQRPKISCKSLILLVGATGFEPVTWSTQNSRATRLRYAPAPCRASIHGSVCASKPRRFYRRP